MSTVASSPSRQSERPARHYPKPVWTAILVYRHLVACRVYRRTGKTSGDARINIRRLFRITNGRFNDVAARLDGLRHPLRALPREPGVLGAFSEEMISRIATDLRADGIHRFERQVPKDLCDRLYRFARQAPCRVNSESDTGSEPIRFDPDNPQGTCYHVDDQALHENTDIQALAGDLSLLSIAQAYLGCRPVFTSCTMWWSTAYNDNPDGGQAQLFHCDMNQVKFLKMFIYLTDVDEDTGAHVFVRGSHRRLPKALLEDRRYIDEEIHEHYASDRFLTLAGPAGTFFAEDTRGIHRDR